MHGFVSYQRFGKVRSLRSDRAWLELGRFVATEPCAWLSRYVATKLDFCVVRWTYFSLSVADLDTCLLPLDNCKGTGFYDEQKKTTRKITPGWEGPLKVIEVRRAGTYRLQDSKGLQRPPILTNPHQSGTTTVACPQRIKTGMRHKEGMGMRKPEEQSKSCFSRRRKQRKPGSWVITPTPAPSKPEPVVVLPRKAEYGPCEKQNISGSQGTPGPYASPRSKEETQGSPNDSGSYA
ncbi:hypothetical protein DY000_02006345 [Brassica cretica]|uniref:Uncharacterized protein n=1 Tax=Brassica cretica TaxID=69181 RepID=A0ABQ7CI79_BRACR|nr:hypothetical protein DY000_02006345 [Brassica cretica]